MSKLPVVESTKVLKALKKMGFVEYHRVGSHIQLKHADGRRTTVAIHKGKDVPRGTLKAILRQIDVALEEFISAF